MLQIHNTKDTWEKKPKQTQKTKTRAEESENTQWKKSLVNLSTVSQSSTIQPIYSWNFLPTDQQLKPEPRAPCKTRGN